MDVSCKFPCFRYLLVYFKHDQSQHIAVYGRCKLHTSMLSASNVIERRFGWLVLIAAPFAASICNVAAPYQRDVVLTKAMWLMCILTGW